MMAETKTKGTFLGKPKGMAYLWQQYKWLVLFIALQLLVLYWYVTDQMQITAAAPSIYVCALLTGVHLRRSKSSQQH